MKVALDPSRIATLAPRVRLELHGEVDSTQRVARERVSAGERGPLAIFAEAQTAGRGQHGRTWHSPAGAAIYLSLIWTSARSLQALAGLSLAVGLAVQRTLARTGIQAQLKWPNDVCVDVQKIAGILVEVAREASGSRAIIGIGLNCAMPDAAPIDQAWTDLRRLGAKIDRSELAGLLLHELQVQLDDFEVNGLATAVAAWPAIDALAGKPLWLQQGTERTRAIGAGIDARGRLRVMIDGVEHCLSAADVSVRHEPHLS